MKKSLISLLLLIASIMTLSAADRDPQRGYRGFVDSESFFFPDLGFLVGEGGESDFWTGFSTVHGYQINPHLFVGGGMSFVWVLNDISVRYDSPRLKYMPLFADFRYDVRFNRFTPFVDLRMGCNLLRHGAFSGALTIGYRFSWGRRVALNLALGVNLRGNRRENYESGIDDDGYWSYPTGTYSTGYDAKPVIRLGIEF